MLITFYGFTPGQPPFGHQPLFLVAGHGPMTREEVVKIGHTIPAQAEKALMQAQHEWNNAGPCDDNLGLFHPKLKMAKG